MASTDVVKIVQDAELHEPSLSVMYRRMSDVEAKSIHWLWPGRIARGKLSIIAGDPGLGKSQLTAYMAAVVSMGGVWPVTQERCEAGNVIMLSAEDDVADTIRPRLEAVGADLRRVMAVDAIKVEAGAERAFNLQKDLDKLGMLIEHIGGVSLVVIDPITAYLGDADSHKNAEIRALLAPLAAFATKYDTAVVCVTHLNKGGSSQALLRVTGSLAFVAAARVAFIVAKDQEMPERRLFVPVKNNIGNDQTGFAFSIQEYRLATGIETCRIVWESTEVSIPADQALEGQPDNEQRGALEEAIEFLQEELKDEGKPAGQVKKSAADAGHSEKTLRRAREVLRIKPQKQGGGPWVWFLPPKVPNGAEDAHTKSMGTLGQDGHLGDDGADGKGDKSQ